jgi:hypothetical protein
MYLGHNPRMRLVVDSLEYVALDLCDVKYEMIEGVLLNKRKGRVEGVWVEEIENGDDFIGVYLLV